MNLKQKFLKMRKLYILFFAGVLSVHVLAQVNVGKADQESLLEPISETLSEISIFDTEDPLDITLKYDITSFIRKKAKGEYLPAELIIQLDETNFIKKEIRLKARGNFRRGHCFFPPIYLNFKTDPIENKELEGIRKIKLVTHCSTSKAYQNYILKEYLAYRLFNVLTDKSFRVKLMNINYVDTGKKSRHYMQKGFIIEPIELLAKRTGSIEINGDIVRGKNVIHNELDLVALFNYFIANTDWRVKGGHNMKYIKSLEKLSSRLTPVPYDFDYAGFVGASYAIPQEWTSITNTKQREYLGYCRKGDEAYEKAVFSFMDKKDEIMETISTFEHLSEKERKGLVRFTEDFFELTEKPGVLVGILKRECRDAEF